MIPMISDSQSIGKVSYNLIAGMGLLDYGFLIKNPMDLGTVIQKMKDDRYETVEDVLDDIQLIWDNCKTYNPPNTVRILSLSGFITSHRN